MVNKRRIYILMLAVLAVILTSCSRSSDVGGGEYYRFSDALGREVILSDKPRRTAALLGSFADMWLLSGGDICAAPSDAWEDFGMVSDTAVNIGGAHTPVLELIVSATPDFVIASASTAADVEMCDALTSLGITVAYFDVDDFDGYLHMLDILTDITGRKDLYKLNGTDIAREISEIKAELARAMSGEDRRILLLRASSGSVKAKGSRGTVLGEMLADIGFVNIADSDSSLIEELSVEKIIKNEPYRIFAVTMGDNTEAAIASLERLIADNPAWSGLSAVREERLHIMDRTLFNMKPNARWADAYRVLYETLYE